MSYQTNLDFIWNAEETQLIAFDLRNDILFSLSTANIIYAQNGLVRREPSRGDNVMSKQILRYQTVQNNNAY